MSITSIMKYFLFCYILLFNISCEQTKIVAPTIFSKMVSHRNLGLAYLEEERYSDAVSEFTALIHVAREEPLGYANLGLTYMRMSGELKNSEEWLDKALDLSPNNPDILFLLAKVYELTDRKERAINSLQKVVVNHPDHIRSLYQLGIMLSRASSSNEKQKAIKYLLRVCEQIPGNIASSLKLIELLIENNNTSDALHQLQSLVQTLPVISKDENKLLRNIMELLHEEKTQEAKIPIIMFHNLLKPNDIYQASIFKLRGTKGPIAGSPLFHFLNTKISYKDSETKINNNVTFTNVSQETKLSLINEKLDSMDLNGSNSPLFALGDHDLDGDLDLFVSTKSKVTNESSQYLLRNEQGTFTDQTSLSNIAHSGNDVSASFSDYNNDGYLDLFICNSKQDKLYKNLGGGKYLSEEDIGMEHINNSQKGLFLDLDLEGDLDLFIASDKKNNFYRNNSDGTFTEIGKNSGLDGTSIKSIDVTFSDFDDDGDLDLFVLNKDGSHFFYDNLRQGRFENMTRATGIDIVDKPRNVMTVDYNNDGLVDIFISGLKEHLLYKNLGGSKFELDIAWEKIKTQIKENLYGGPASFFDADNDGYQDILISSPMDGTENYALYLLYNDGNGEFMMPLMVANVNSRSVKQMQVADYDNDGDLDIFLSTTSNQIQLLRNDGGNINNFIKVELTGLRTGSSKNNYFGIGSKVELKAGDLYQIKYMDQPLMHFGIGGQDSADVVRVVWSNGVSQNRFKPQKNQTIVEKQILKGSCPYLFGWSGNEFEFISDVLWPSALGMPLGIMAGEPMYAFPNSTDEYLRVPGERLEIKEDSYLLQFTTELWETPYLDKIKLMVIDHPKDVEVFIDETFIPPPYPEFRIYSYREKNLPVKAVDSNGIDQLQKISLRDNEHIANIYPDLYQGVTEFHDLILEFENLNTTDSLFLFLQGWLFPTDASINVNLSHSNSLGSIFPYLQIPNEKGEWKTIIKNIGFPKGKNKTMVINLTNKFINDDYRIRIRTNMQIYWDHAFIANSPYDKKINTTELKPIFADLHYRGFSAISQKNQSNPHIPNYYSVETGQKWRDLIGRYTKYGDVLELLMESDNKYVIMNSGDEITLKFDASNLPHLPSDWTRDFLFYNDGWLKDGDLNTARGKTVQPLPFHGMVSYPEGAENKYPSDEEHNSYIEKYNTRQITTDEFRGLLKNSRK